MQTNQIVSGLSIITVHNDYAIADNIKFSGIATELFPVISGADAPSLYTQGDSETEREREGGNRNRGRERERETETKTTDRDIGIETQKEMQRDTKRDRKRQKQRERELISWCFEPSQPQRITSGLNTNFTLSPS